MSIAFEQTFEVITQINRAVKPQEICDGLTAFTRRYGLTAMIAGTMPASDVHGEAQEQHLLVSAFPAEWMQRYLEREYVHVDPVIGRIKQSFAPFSWSEATDAGARRTSKDGRRVLDEAKAFNLRAGFAVPMITLDGAIAAVSFGGERIDLEPSAPGMISMISSFAIARAIELRSRDLRRVESRLTRREIECMKWVAEGKTDWDIAHILHISEHTVEAHITNAYRKLKAVNRAQAVANAIRLDLIR